MNVIWNLNSPLIFQAHEKRKAKKDVKHANAYLGPTQTQMCNEKLHEIIY